MDKTAEGALAVVSDELQEMALTLMTGQMAGRLSEREVFGLTMAVGALSQILEKLAAYFELSAQPKPKPKEELWN
jgi:hypothetical protein